MGLHAIYKWVKCPEMKCVTAFCSWRITTRYSLFLGVNGLYSGPLVLVSLRMDYRHRWKRGHTNEGPVLIYHFTSLSLRTGLQRVLFKMDGEKRTNQHFKRRNTSARSPFTEAETTRLVVGMQHLKMPVRWFVGHKLAPKVGTWQVTPPT